MTASKFTARLCLHRAEKRVVGSSSLQCLVTHYQPLRVIKASTVSRTIGECEGHSALDVFGVIAIFALEVYLISSDRLRCHAPAQMRTGQLVIE